MKFNKNYLDSNAIDQFTSLKFSFFIDKLINTFCTYYSTENRKKNMLFLVRFTYLFVFPFFSPCINNSQTKFQEKNNKNKNMTKFKICNLTVTNCNHNNNHNNFYHTNANSHCLKFIAFGKRILHKKHKT